MEHEPMVDWKLVKHVENYFHLLRTPEPGDTVEDTMVRAGDYFSENIEGKFSDMQINVAFWMNGL